MRVIAFEPQRNRMPMTIQQGLDVFGLLLAVVFGPRAVVLQAVLARAGSFVDVAGILLTTGKKTSGGLAVGPS